MQNLQFQVQHPNSFELRKAHKLKKNPRDTGRVSLGHPAGQTGVYRPVSQGFPVNYYRKADREGHFRIYYHCHQKHYRPEKILSELFPAILDRIITGKYSKRINLIVIRAHYRNHLAVHRSHDTRTEIPWTKSCNELPDDNSPTINSVIFDRNITGENSQRINLAMISVRISIAKRS